MCQTFARCSSQRTQMLVWQIWLLVLVPLLVPPAVMAQSTEQLKRNSAKRLHRNQISILVRPAAILQSIRALVLQVPLVRCFIFPFCLDLSKLNPFAGGQYEEFTAEINENTLCVRVPKNVGTVKRIYDNQASIEKMGSKNVISF